MQIRHLQMLMAATGDYAGGIDGAFGPISHAAMLAVAFVLLKPCGCGG